ncbi:hypothetical protein Tco_1002002 [Tanacetum coccineum]|uniref:Uncharacterized protein n=1 Tax=Tanacetum coccineum TaxID=301880 RepID=A0ABQ5F5M3_9ASTR
MSNLKFAETHNLVAFFEKPEESDGFEGIINFLNASSIRYALMVNSHHLYLQPLSIFWATAKAKTVNREVQIQALVDGKKKLERIRISGSEIPTDPQHTPTIIQPSTSQPQKKQPRRKQRKDTEVPQPSGSTNLSLMRLPIDHVPVHSNDPLLSGEDRLKLNELMELCTNLSQRFLDLENTKTSQAAEIAKLKEKVKKLEIRSKSRTPGLKRLWKVGRSAQVVSSKDEEVTLVDEAQGRIDDNLMFDTGVFDDTTTTAVTRPKARGVVVQEPSKFTTTTSQPSQLPQAKDKGKAKIIEPEKPLKKKDQILVDEEIAQRLQEELKAELEEKERLARQKEEEDNLISWDNTQAMLEADYEFMLKEYKQKNRGEFLPLKKDQKCLLAIDAITTCPLSPQSLLTVKSSKKERWDTFKSSELMVVQETAPNTTNADGTSTSLIPGLVTIEEKAQKKNDVKTLFASIQTRFGGNDATKKTQETFLKQMYENFSAPSTESLDSIFNRLQKIVSQLAILGENISQEDLNLKFLRSLPSEWNTHVVVKGTASSSSSSSSQNMAFVSSPSSTNEVNTTYGVSTANTQVSPASTQVSTAIVPLT